MVISHNLSSFTNFIFYTSVINEPSLVTTLRSRGGSNRIDGILYTLC